MMKKVPSLRRLTVGAKVKPGRNSRRKTPSTRASAAVSGPAGGSAAAADPSGAGALEVGVPEAADDGSGCTRTPPSAHIRSV